MYACAYIPNWIAKIRKYEHTKENKNIKFYKMSEKLIYTKKKTLQPRKATGYHPKWALTDSNRRPSACKADALNQLS